MYKHILIATDGSEVSQKAAAHAVAVAKALSSKLLVVTVTEPYEAVVVPEARGLVAPKDYNKQCEEAAARILSEVTSAADAAGIACDAIHKVNRWPYEGVIEAAGEAGADLIIVGSHGRSGLQGLLLGSQAVKLLTHSKTPALVVR